MWTLSRRRLADLGFGSALPPGPSPADRGQNPSLCSAQRSHSQAAPLPPGLARLEVAVVGSLPSSPRVAVVGARAASSRAIQFAEHVVEHLEREGLGLLSGGARGIDGEVHRAALRRDVRQGVVLPLHLSTPYPPEHEGLFRDIAARGDGIVCPLQVGTPPGRWAFVARNRWLVALSHRVVVIEAARRSGSMHTGRLALSWGRSLASFAGSPGGDALIAAGAACLGHLADPPSAMRHGQLEAFLRGDVGPDSRAPTWPAHLAELRGLIGDRHGFTLHDVGPRLFAKVLDAENRGLVVRVDAVRYSCVGVPRGGADQGGDSEGVALVSPPTAPSKGPNP